MFRPMPFSTPPFVPTGNERPFNLPPGATPPIMPQGAQGQAVPLNMNDRLTGLLGNPMFRAGLALLGTQDKRQGLNNALQGVQGAAEHQQQMALFDFEKQKAMREQEKYEAEQTDRQRTQDALEAAAQQAEAAGNPTAAALLRSQATASAGAQLLKPPTAPNTVREYEYAMQGVPPEKRTPYSTWLAERTRSPYDDVLKALAVDSARTKQEAAEREAQEARIGKQTRDARLHTGLDIVNSLKTDPSFRDIYGPLQGRTPIVKGASAAAAAKRDQLVDILNLAARGELKGQGPITEGEQAMLARAQTILNNPLIPDEQALEELNRIESVLIRMLGGEPATPSSQPPTGGTRVTPGVVNWGDL